MFFSQHFSFPLSVPDTNALSSLNIPRHTTSQSWPWDTQFVFHFTSCDTRTMPSVHLQHNAVCNGIHINITACCMTLSAPFSRKLQYSRSFPNHLRLTTIIVFYFSKFQCTGHSYWFRLKGRSYHRLHKFSILLIIWGGCRSPAPPAHHILSPTHVFKTIPLQICKPRGVIFTAGGPTYATFSGKRLFRGAGGSSLPRTDALSFG